jgi:uncharacterized protein (TIGR02611 family)
VPLLEPIMRVLARFARRGAIFIVGVVLLAAGAAMMVLPGPGIATVLLGLIVLAKEFSWARRALAWVRHRAVELKQQAQARMPGTTPRPSTDPPPGRNRPDQAA